MAAMLNGLPEQCFKDCRLSNSTWCSHFAGMAGGSRHGRGHYSFSSCISSRQPEQAQERWRGGRSMSAQRRWYQWPHLSHRTPFISTQSVLGGITTEQAIHNGMSEFASGNTFGTSHAGRRRHCALQHVFHLCVVHSLKAVKKRYNTLKMGGNH